MDKSDKNAPMGRGGSPWQNRIVGEGVKPASQFMANEKNWRVHPQAQRDALHGALNEVGWVAPVIENVRTGCLVDGHERVWQALQNDDAEVPYVQVDLSPEEEAYVLATLDPIGAMAQADQERLRELLQEVHTEEGAVQQLLDDLLIEEKAESNPYSRNVETPIYQPSAIRPAVSELYDDTRTQQLVAAIQEAEGLTEEERQFLSIAAQRHTVLYFNKIADYYAHASPTLQRLMEDNALVIIDFHRAIELGFVRLTQSIAEQVLDEYGA